MKRLKKWTTLLAVAAFVMLAIPQWTLSVSATEASGGLEDGNIASGKDNDIEWVIDADGKLTISGSGDLSYNGYGQIIKPWAGYESSIKSVVCNVTGMFYAKYLFSSCSNMTSIDLSGFDASNIYNMDFIFVGCNNLSTIYAPYNLKLSVTLPGASWYLPDGTQITELPQNLSNSVILTRKPFGKDGNITWAVDANGKLTISGSGNFASSKNDWYHRTMPWDSYKNDIKSAVCSVTGMTNVSKLFYGCENMTSVDLSGFDSSHITDMSGMFSGCSSLTSLDVSKFDTSNVTDMRSMFSGCESLTSLDVSKFDTSNVTDMSDMFYHCSSLTSLDVNNFDTSNVEQLGSMFENCSSLINLDLSGFNTSKVTWINNMFNGCKSLLNIDLSSFDISNVSEVEFIFTGCNSLISVNLSSWDMTFLSDDFDEWSFTDFLIYELEDSKNLQTIYTPYNLGGPMTLPGTGWHLADGTEITELPKNLSASVMVTRKPLDAIDDDNNNSDNKGDSDDDNQGSSGENNNTNSDNNKPDDNNNQNNGGNTGSSDDNNSGQGGNVNDADKDNNHNNQPNDTSGVLEGTGNTTDSAIYGRRLITANPTDYKTILLSWDEVPNAKSYEIFYSTSKDSGFKRLANVKKTFYKFTRAKCGETYYFQMRVCQKGKVKSEFGPISYGKTGLESAATLQVKKRTYNSVTLKWNKVTGAKRYEIYYADSMGNDWQYLTTKSGTSFTHKKLVTGATYYYQIRPVRESFYGKWSNDASAITVLGDVSNLKVKATGADQMKLTWRKVKGVNQYVIKRSESIDGDYEVIGYSDRASYRDTGLKSGTTYFYKVCAVSGPYRTKDTAPVGQTTKIPKK